MFDITPAAPEGTVSRELTILDLADLNQGTAPPVSPVKRLRDSHHAVARLLAEGRRDVEVSAITGYTTRRIAQLRDDPAFAELVEFYRSNLVLEAQEFGERLVALGYDAIQELQTRLDETPESFSNRELKDMLALTSDRTGYGPKSTAVNINVNLADRLESARRRVIDLVAEPTE